MSMDDTLGLGIDDKVTCLTGSGPLRLRVSAIVLGTLCFEAQNGSTIRADLFEMLKPTWSKGWMDGPKLEEFQFEE